MQPDGTRIIGEVFDTYWLIEYEDKLFIIDQHAAHEKVLYERTMVRVPHAEFCLADLKPADHSDVERRGTGDAYTLRGADPSVRL